MAQRIEEYFRKMDDFAVVEVYGFWLTELKRRGILELITQ